MICFDLVCGQGHGFEGWFKSGQGFDEQVAVGTLACPVCGDSAVRKGVMAPAVLRRRPTGGAAAGVEREGGTATTPASAGESSSDPRHPALGELLRTVRRVQDYVEKNFENVDDRFADEARRMHHGEVERRDIYGRATADEAEALREEGIPIRQLPVLPKLDG
jgi:hypothetical protein